MPFGIEPVRGSRSPQVTSQEQLFKNPAVSWLTKQPYDPDQMFNNLQSNPYRRGTIAGGQSLSQFINFGNEQKWAVVKPRPVTSKPVLADEEKLYRRNLGAIEWDSVDPLSIFGQTADQAQQLVGGDPLGFLRAPANFLAGKDIDLFGMEDTGVPARAADYFVNGVLALSGLLAAGDPQAFLQSTPQGRDPAAHDAFYQFHADPRYWSAVANGTDGDLDVLAQSIAAQYMDPGGNSYFVSMLRQQFEKDRKTALGLSSGNEAIDYRSIKAYAARAKVAGVGIGADVNTQWALSRALATNYAGLLPTIPFVGTQLAQLVDPIHPEEQALWESLDPEVRGAMLGFTGVQQMAGEVITTLPALSGLGVVMNTARSAGGAARYAANIYDWTLRGSLAVTEAGVGIAVANWALEAYVPHYSETLGRQIDASRPISGSVLAGTVNALGYWSTGSWGTAIWFKGGARTLRAAVGKVGSVVDNVGPSIRGIGTREISTFDMSGGARGTQQVVDLFPDAPAGSVGRGIITSQQELAMSNLIHTAHDPRIERASAILRGEKTGDDVIDALTPEERVTYVQEQLQHDMEGSHANAAQFAYILQEARKPEPLLGTPADRKIWRWFQAQARTIEQALEVRFTRDYGPAWAARTAGAYTPEAMDAYVRKTIERLGGDASRLQAKSTDDLLKTMRMLHQYEFSLRNGELASAIADVASESGNKLSLVSQRHLFGDEVEASIAILRGGDKEAASLEARRIVERTIEGERWFSKEWHPEGDLTRNIDNIDPAELADYIEDVQSALLIRRKLPAEGSDTADLPVNVLHAKMDSDGAWTLAFKPENEAGQFVSYVHPRKGGTFQTPWLDYPMGNSHNIELGNRGMMGRKYDAIFRGFRTNRISEFQRGSMFRILTGEFPNFTPTQIETFFSDVMQLARRHVVQPQTLGTVRRGPGSGSFGPDVEAAAHRVFGKGPYIDKRGVERDINWQDVIAKSYRQSVKLNLTAGLTSHLKAGFGPVGHSAAWLSDIGYVWFRFHVSLLFKLGEPAESLSFNAMNGVNPRGDPLVESLFARTGMGNQHGVALAEVNYDQAMAGLGGMANTTPATRQARAYSFYALNAPETLAQKQAREALRAQSDAHAAFLRDGHDGFAEGQHALDVQIAEMTDDAGNIVHGNEEAVDALLREKEALAEAEAWVAEVKAMPLATDKEGLLAQLRQTISDGSVERPGGFAPRVGEGLDAWRAQLWDELKAGTPIPPTDGWYRAMSDAEFEAARVAGSFRPLAGKDLFVTNDVDRLAGGNFGAKGGGYIVEFDPAQVTVHDTSSRTVRLFEQAVEEAPVASVRRVYRWDPVRQDHILLADTTLGPIPKGDPLPGLEERHREVLAALERIDRGDLPPGELMPDGSRVDQVDDIEDIFGSAEHVQKVAREQFPDMVKPTRLDRVKNSHPWESGFVRTLRNPIPMKERQADLYAIEQMRRDFPTLLEASGADGAIRVFEDLGIPERDWLPFLLEDRALAERFSVSGHPDDLQKLLDHAGGPDPQGEFDELYASDEWATITGLMAVNIRTAEADAFGVHFFNPYRSAIERSLNHPLTGIYPLSWSLKAARQWVKFLYDNETIAGLNIHMVPAVALAQIVRAQKTAFAMSNDEDLDTFLDHDNPLGSTFLIFNLIMPGDWSSIPFPASRTIRDLVRGDWDARTMGDNLVSWGGPRDLRLSLEAAGELRDFIWGPEQQDPNTPWKHLTPTENDTYKPLRPTKPVTINDQIR